MAGEEAEEVLGSRGRIRLLKALLAAKKDGRAVTVSKLKATTHLKGGTWKGTLKSSVRRGWVEEVQMQSSVFLKVVARAP
ncbi:MAG: hypothetical protein QXS21_00900 [Thermoproteota archaeon]|nr:hypothetical protein [Candidatus Brockarchaeota archaeon]MBO3768595.1 hypothetical protein [Candidatus Brockarchaeota archaeon]MBO3800971.1 hypothetical protein [Candidatus Brockarchaeota archaeon]